MLLDVDSLDAYYGKSHVLHDVSLSVNENEIVAYLGRNGAGKSTTIRSIVGLVPDIEGEIRFRGEVISGLPPERIFDHGISWIPEERRLFTNTTVEENLQMGVHTDSVFDVPDVDYEEVYDLFPRLKERRTQLAGTLSGGEQQMLAIGRAMVSNPDLILVDEPFEGLMLKLIPDIADVIRELTDRGISLLVAEQKSDLTLELADRVFVLENGSIVFSGEPAELKDDEKLLQRYLGVSTQ